MVKMSKTALTEREYKEIIGLIKYKQQMNEIHGIKKEKVRLNCLLSLFTARLDDFETDCYDGIDE